MMSSTEIDEKAVRSAKKFLRSEVDLLVNVERVDEARVWERLTYTSLFNYCTKRLRLSEATASAVISVARKSKAVPELREAVIDGVLSVSQAKRIVSVIDPANAKAWVEKASTLKQRDLEREVASTLPGPAQEERLKYVGSEMSELRLVIPERIRGKLERLVEVRGCSMIDAFDFALEEALKRHDPLRKAARNLGRKSRSSRNEPVEAKPGRAPIAAQTNHALTIRDEARCTFIHPDGARCENQRWLHRHHITRVSRGGGNEPDNIALLCAQHHRFVHGPGLPPKNAGPSSKRL